jgi:hypothetical protein
MSDAHPRLAPTLEAELSVEDQRWFRSIDWSDSRVPPVASEADATAYARREAALTKAIDGLTFAERGDSAEGRLAAAIGAALANWRERDEDE